MIRRRINNPKAPKLHASEREAAILRLLGTQAFVSFQDIDRTLSASPASLRRDLDRLEKSGKLQRVHGGARAVGGATPALEGAPFRENVGKNAQAKAAIGLAAAALCEPGEAIIIDGGSTTLQMCAHIDGLGLQVLTNALNIVIALLPQTRTRVSIPAGNLFREQNIVLSPYDEDGISNFQASRFFTGAAAVGQRGPMQADTLLIQAERRFLKRAEKVVLMVDASKFDAPTGHLLCPLDEIDTLITDPAIKDAHAQMIERAGVKLIIAAPSGREKYVAM
jgi:DeoR family transcriptional regulator, ulaG and ulaABCDEF operon transcriptional repressor